MKFSLLSKSLPSFGLQVSGGSFKVMQMEKRSGGFEVKGYHNLPLPKGAIINDGIADSKKFSVLLENALQKPQFGKFSTKYVVASLPESKSFIRVIQLPKMSLDEAENAVPYEAENFIPLPIDQVYLDWQKIGESGDKMSILIIASPKDFVDKYLEVIDKAGLKPVALEVESQSCHRALCSSESSETTLLLDMGFLRTSLIMVEDGNLQFTSSIPIAGTTFTESIARSLGVSSAKAEEIKRQVGIANTAQYPNITEALWPVLNNLSEEIKNILKFHSEHSQKQVDKVLLFGGSSRLTNLPEFLSTQLQAAGINKVELANPWQNAKLVKISPLDAQESLECVSTIGLAMRGAENIV